MIPPSRPIPPPRMAPAHPQIRPIVSWSIAVLSIGVRATWQFPKQCAPKTPHQPRKNNDFKCKGNDKSNPMRQFNLARPRSHSLILTFAGSRAPVFTWTFAFFHPSVPPLFLEGAARNRCDAYG